LQQIDTKIHQQMGVKKLVSPLLGIGKNVQNEQTEPKQGFSLFWVTRRRTWVRRVAKFVRSKKA